MGIISQLQNLDRITESDEAMPVTKSSSTYESAVSAGDEAFERASLDEAVAYYNTAVQHAQTASQLSVVLANRAVLASLCRKYESSVRDFGRALRLYPQTSGNELAAEWDKLRQAAIYRLNKQYSRARRYPQQQLFAGEHKCYANVSEAIRVEYDAHKGRKMVAAVDIPPGQVLIKEKPFVWALDADYACVMCQYCCRPLPFDWLPCHSCARPNVRFCNAQCRDRAWNAFHRYECVLEGDLRTHQLFAENPSLDVMAQRILCNTPLQQLLKHLQLIHSSSAEAEDAADDCKPCSDSAKAAPSSTAAAATEMTRQLAAVELTDGTTSSSSSPAVASRFGVDGRGYGHNIASLVSLQAYADSEMDWGEDEALPELLRVTSPSASEVKRIERMALYALRQLRLRVVLNSCSLQVISGHDDGHLCLPKGSALYMMTSLVNHSCLPNLRRHFASNVIQVRTIAHIKAGEELTFSYGALYGRLARAERQTMMKEAYGFTCDCAACTQRQYADMERHMFAQKAATSPPVNAEESKVEPETAADSAATTAKGIDTAVTTTTASEDTQDKPSLPDDSQRDHLVTLQPSSKQQPAAAEAGSSQAQADDDEAATPDRKPLSIAQMDSMMYGIMYDQSASTAASVEMERIERVLATAETYFGADSFLMLDYLIPAVLYFNQAGDAQAGRADELIAWLVRLVELFFGADCGREWWTLQMPALGIDHYHRHAAARQVPVAARGGGRQSHSRTNSQSSSN